MKEFDKLFDVVKTLRGKRGCPWDRKQTPKSMVSSLIEEVYEIVDAIETNNAEDLKEELGDLFFLTLFISYLGEQKNLFRVSEVLKEITEKLVRRHPHVFGSINEKNVEQIILNWENIKLSEAKNINRKTPFDGIPKRLPEIQKFFKILEKAKRAGIEIEIINPESLFSSLNEYLKSKKESNLSKFIEDLLIFSFQNKANLPNIIRKLCRKKVKEFTKKVKN